MDDGERVVGVVGDAPGAVSDAIDAAGDSVRAGDAGTVLDADPAAVVAVGEPAVLAVARRATDVPVLPIDTGRGFQSVPSANVEGAVESLLADEHETVPHPVLSVRVNGSERARAVTDVTLVTAEAAHISEYSVATDGEHVGQFRADGVVVATPAGSPGYARRLDGPVVAPGTGVAAVVPIAPFATDPDHWVLPMGAIGLAVEREEASVELVADDRTVGPVGVAETVEITRDGDARFAVVPQSQPRYP